MHCVPKDLYCRFNYLLHLHIDYSMSTDRNFKIFPISRCYRLGSGIKYSPRGISLHKCWILSPNMYEGFITLLKESADSVRNNA